jgi:2-methylisocitrate lyase-like PEP mutase family enzyme
MVFVEAPSTPEELQAIPRALKVPTLFNMASSGKTPFLHLDEIAWLGFKLAIYPNFAILSAIPVVRRFLRELQKEGTVAHLRDSMATFVEWFDIVGMDEIKSLEARYGTPEDRRAAY